MIKQLLFFLFIPVVAMAQIQIGDNIEGAWLGWLGNTTVLSADGSIVAVGGPGNQNLSDPGRVRIYEDISGVWTQIGDDINGEASGDWSGVVSLSADGKIVAIGAGGNSGNGHLSGHVRIYENISGVWTQVGNDIDGEAAGDQSGSCISLSADGGIVAIGAYKNNGNGSNSGHVRVYGNISGVWTQMGQDIDGEASGDSSGISVSLSSDGRLVAIGAYANAGNGLYSGHVRVYRHRAVSDTWVQVGDDIDGKVAYEMAGRDVSLSADGTIVAIGVPGKNGARVYRNVSGVWTQIGADIINNNSGTNNNFGDFVSLSSDGSMVAVSGEHTEIYADMLGMGLWLKRGNTINGGRAFLSSDSKRVTVDVSSATDKYVQVYDLSNLSSSDDFILESFDLYPNPTSDVLNITLENNLKLERVTLYNNLGQVVKVSKEYTLNVDALFPGIYFVEVTTNQGKAAKKVIVK